MEQEILWTLKALALPPGSLILLGLLGLLLKRRMLGKLIIFASLASLYLLSTPFAAQQLMKKLEYIPAVTERQIETTEARAIVVLGGGRREAAPEYGGDTVSSSTLERLRYAAHLSRTTGLGVIPSGGSHYPGQTPEAALMRASLERDFQVKVAASEEKSRNTRENAEMTASLLRSMGIQKVLLVTHAAHMPRAFAAFERSGITAVAAPTAFDHTGDTPSLLDNWLPKASHLLNSYRVLHEFLGSWWYRVSS